MTTLRTFDVWDTLLRRRCHPDEVKLFTAWHVFLRLRDRLKDQAATPWTLFEARRTVEKAIADEHRAAGLDPEYEITEVFLRWIRQTLRLRGGKRARAALAADLADVELRQELRVSYLDPAADALARAANGDRLIALSDFYMRGPSLTRLLASKAPHLRFERALTSCDARLCKRSGRLFTHLHEQTGVGPSRHTHFGNSPGADITPARALGVNAILFANPPEDSKAAAHHSRFMLRGPGCRPDLAPLDAEIRAVCRPPPGLTARQRDLYLVGLRLAPIFCGLVLRAVETAAFHRARSVYYFTREGAFFKSLHEAMAPVRPGDLPFPRARLLEVSRISTFFPSIREFTTTELMRLWNMYASQSMAQLLRTFAVGVIAAEPLLARHGLDPSERIRRPWSDPRVKALLDDPVFQRLLEQRRDRRRADAIDFFRSRGIRDSGKPRVIVDIGWRGTIQDNLAYLFPSTPFHAVYFGLQPLLNEQPPNVTKVAFGPDANRDDPAIAALLRFVAPLEMVCNTGGGSVRIYARGADGAVAAVTQDHPDESAVHERYTRFVQAGALAAAPVVAAWCGRHAVWSDELRPACLERLRELVNTPPRALAKAFFSLAHDEMFGEGGVVRKFGRLPRLQAWRARTAEHWPDFVKLIQATNWPQGFLTLNRQPRLLARYNREHAAAPTSPTPRATAGVIEAKRELELLERSRAWRLLNGIKKNAVYAAYASRRWGPGWDRPPEFETADDRLARLKASRTYKLIVRAKASRLYQLVRRSG